MTPGERALLLTMAECLAVLVSPVSREWSQALQVAIRAVDREQLPAQLPTVPPNRVIREGQS